MNSALVFLTNFYWILLPQWLAENLWYANWRKARRQGWTGVAWEFVRSVLSLNVHALSVYALAGWSPGQVSQWLAQHGIATWGWVYDEEWMLFHVRLRQARYAQFLLVQAGLPYR